MNDAYLILGAFGTLLVLVGMIAFIGLLYKGVIRDEDKDFIPDELEDRASAVIEEIKDTKNAIVNVKNQAGDILDAAKGKKRRGRPRKNGNEEKK